MPSSEPDILRVESISQNVETPIPRSTKEVFSQIKNFDDLLRQFVFYSPIAHYLIGDIDKTRLATDIISYTLAQTAKEHPLVITELPRPVFYISAGVLVPPEVKQMRHTLYAVQKEVWEATAEALSRLVIMDSATRRFCLLSPREWKIQNPIGKDAMLELPVWFFSCFGNRETYFFESTLHAQTPEKYSNIREIPLLRDGMPIKEVVDLAADLFHFHGPFSEARAIETQNRLSSVVQDPLKPINPKDIPVKDISLDHEYRREVDELIRFYRSVFPAN